LEDISVSNASSVYTTQDCFAALRLYLKETEEVPSRSGYSAWCVGRDVPATSTILGIIVGRRDRKARWKKVLKAADMSASDVEKRRREKISRFSKESCRRAIEDCRSKLHRLPNTTEYNEWRNAHSGYPSYLTIVRKGDPKFPKSQSWNEALRGLGYESGLPERDYTTNVIPPERCVQDLVDAVLVCAAELGDVPSSYAYDRFVEEHRSEESTLPTSTTLRRRLGGPDDTTGGRWRDVLVYCGLNPKQQSAAKSRNFREQQRSRCEAAIKAFTEQLGGFSTVPNYVRWSLMDETRPSVTSILSWLAPRCRSWVRVGRAVFGRRLCMATATVAEVDAISLPKLAPRRTCINALRAFVADSGGELPSFLGYRLWRQRNSYKRLPTEGEILCQLAPLGGSWSTALANANGELSGFRGRILRAKTNGCTCRATRSKRSAATLPAESRAKKRSATSR